MKKSRKWVGEEVQPKVDLPGLMNNVPNMSLREQVALTLNDLAPNAAIRAKDNKSFVTVMMGGKEIPVKEIVSEVPNAESK